MRIARRQVDALQDDHNPDKLRQFMEGMEIDDKLMGLTEDTADTADTTNNTVASPTTSPRINYDTITSTTDTLTANAPIAESPDEMTLNPFDCMLDAISFVPSNCGPAIFSTVSSVSSVLSAPDTATPETLKTFSINIPSSFTASLNCTKNKQICGNIEEILKNNNQIIDTLKLSNIVALINQFIDINTNK